MGMCVLLASQPAFVFVGEFCTFAKFGELGFWMIIAFSTSQN
jgi:hypothetical protein